MCVAMQDGILQKWFVANRTKKAPNRRTGLFASTILAATLAFSTVGHLSKAQAQPAQQQRPNIVVIMGDDIGIWNIGAYHRGMMAGRTPNLDKIAAEGMLFTDYYAEASCPSEFHHRTAADPHRHDHGRPGWRSHRSAGRSANHCDGAQIHGLRHGNRFAVSPMRTDR